MSILQKIRSRGVFHSAELIFNRCVPAWLFRFSVGDVFELDTERLCGLSRTRSDTAFQCQHVTDPQQRDALRRATRNSVPLSTSASDHGYRIHSAQSDTGLLGGVWGGVDAFLEADLGFRIELEPDQAWIYCAFVIPAARGTGVYQHLLAYAASDLHGRGHAKLRVMIQPWNRASVHVHEKYSRRRIGRVLAIRVFSLACVLTTGSVRRTKTFTTRLASSPVEIRID